VRRFTGHNSFDPDAQVAPVGTDVEIRQRVPLNRNGMLERIRPSNRGIATPWILQPGEFASSARVIAGRVPAAVFRFHLHPAHQATTARRRKSVIGTSR
jgi:hypothetical protein